MSRTLIVNLSPFSSSTFAALFVPEMVIDLTIAGLRASFPLKAVEPVISWKDGLPDDEAETVQIEAMAVAAGITSKVSAMKRAYDYDDKQAADEQKLIEKETPTIAEPVNFAAKTDNDDGSGA